jgi:hypothetical protein
LIRILRDSFFHMPPGNRIGRHVATGGYVVNVGRYSLGDCYHPNGLAFLEAELADEYSFANLQEPYSAASLSGADILLITNPDYPLYQGASPHRWTPEDVDALLAFVERGGGVLLMVNSFLSRPDFWEENFDLERVNMLFKRLGVQWDDNFMSDDSIIEPAQSGSQCVGYGQGGRVLQGRRLPDGAEPLLTYQGNIYGFLIRVGVGKLAVLGDTGMMSNGLVCFPGFENTAFMRDVLDRIRPAWCGGNPPQMACLKHWHISAAPSANGLNETTLRALRPKATWRIDHHYRHLVWEEPAQCVASEVAQTCLPLDLGRIAEQDLVEIPLHWVKLDGDLSGPVVPIRLRVHRRQNDHGTELHILGRTVSRDLNWSELCQNEAFLSNAGRLTEAHVVFEARILLDRAHALRSARWQQGQIFYAQSAQSLHYGYEIVLSSASGVISPIAQV